MDAGIIVSLKVWLAVFSSLSYCYIIGKIVPKGITRLICILPIVFLFFYLPLLITSVNLSGNTSFMITWLGNFKLLLFAFDQGPLASHASMSLPLFVSISSLPIKIQDPRPKNANFNQDSYLKSLLPYAIKALCLALVSQAYEYRQYIHPKGILVLYSFHIYFALEFILVIVAATTRALLGLELEPQFDEPYKSSSLQDFWGHRWNLMVTGILRPTVYEPLLNWSGRITGQKWASLPAVFGTFLVSGLMHELIFYYMSRTKPTWEVTCFFILHGISLILEIVLKKFVKGRWRVPSVMASALTIGFIMVTGFWLFFPPLLKSKADLRALEEYAALGAFVKNISRRNF